MAGRKIASKIMAKMIDVLTWTAVGIAVLTAVLLGGVRLAGFTPYAVSSGSMEPACHVGSAVYVRKVDADELETGDVITFRLGGDALATHRIVEVIHDGDELSFRTKGDANDVADAAPVEADRVVGRVCFSIPYLGYCAAYIGSLGRVGAWLRDANGPAANLFNTAVSGIDIVETDTGIDEDDDDSTNTYEIVPDGEGEDMKDINKDPAVTIPAGSADCWVFVRIEETDGFSDLMYYEVAEGWTRLDGEDAVYYRTSSRNRTERRYHVLRDDAVRIRKGVTRSQLNSLTKGQTDSLTTGQIDPLTTGACPGLRITAAAVQLAGFATASEAWTNIKP